MTAVVCVLFVCITVLALFAMHLRDRANARLSQMQIDAAKAEIKSVADKALAEVERAKTSIVEHEQRIVALQARMAQQRVSM